MRFQLSARFARLVLALLLLVDLAWSFYLHYHSTLDGDIAKIVLPSPDYKPVLHDPFGLRALLRGEYSVGPNRFVAHWSMERYFKTVPILLQRFCSPLDSVYLAIAFAKTGIQAAQLWGMSAWVSGTARPTAVRFLFSAAVLAPFFQSFGFNWHFGLVDASVTYSFFYAAASAWLLLFFYPAVRYFLHNYTLPTSRLAALGLVLAAWISAFNGPLNPAVMLLLCPPMTLVLLCRCLERKWNSRGGG